MTITLGKCRTRDGRIVEFFHKAEYVIVGRFADTKKTCKWDARDGTCWHRRTCCDLVERIEDANGK